jgi:hypothetical protein
MTTATVTQPTPYSLQASCELSEDHFLTSDLIIGTGDEVIPFLNPYTKMVEAIVFTQANGGSVYHLQRDPSATSGWLPYGLALSGNVANPTDVAVAGNGSAVYLLVFGTPDNYSGGPAWLTQLDSAAVWDEGYNATYDELGFLDLDIDPSTIGSFKGGIDQHGNCYFYASGTDPSTQTTSVVGWLPGSGWASGEVSWQLLQTLDSSSVTISDYTMLYDASNSQSPVGYSLILTTDQYLNVYAEVYSSDQATPQFGVDPLTDTGSSNVTALLWAWITDTSSGVPGYAYQTANETYFVAGDGSAYQSVFDQPAAAANSVAVWTSGSYVVNLLDSNGALNTILQNPDHSWQAPIPTVPGHSTTVPGLASIFSVPTDPSQSTLFAVGLDESLSVLSLDDSGWTQTLVRQDGTQLVEIDSYRAQISLLDANGVPVAGGQAQIGTDRPIGFWQPAGSSFVTPAAPVTLTADNKGEITFSVPAEELDCAVLSVQALDPNGNPTGSPFTVTTDYDVRGFLGGTGTLTDIGPISGDALQQAKNSSGSALFPGLSGDDQTQARTDTMTALNQFIVAGQNTQTAPGPSETSMVQLTMSGQVPTVVTATGLSGYLSEEIELTLSIGHLFDTIGHALRHGAAKLANLTVQWSDALKGWAVQIGAEIAGAVQQFANLVITDMKDAFHAIGGFFQALGADIAEAIQWLKHNVLDLLKDAWANAGTIATFIDSAPPAFAYQVQQLEFSANNFFTGLETETTNLINEVAVALTGMTVGSPAQQPTPSSDTGSTSSQSRLLKDVGEFTKVINDSPGKWLLDKITADVPPIVSLGVPLLPQANYETLTEDLATDWNKGMQFVQSLQTFMQATFEGLFGRTKGSALSGRLDTMFLDTLLNDANSAAVNFLEFCDDVADTVLDVAIQALNDFGAYLTTTFKLVSSRSLLGQLLDLVGINPTISLSEIAGLIVAFPATLVSEIVGNGRSLPALPALPTGSSVAAPGEAALDGESDPVKLWLGILGGTTQAIWGMADIIGDLQTMTGDDGTRGTQSGAIDILDIMCPLFESGFLFPLPLDQKLEKQLVPPIIFTALLPSIFGSLALMSWPKLNGMISDLPTGVGDVISDYAGPFIQAFAGAANTALGVAFQVKNGDTVPTDIAGTVLGNLSFMLAVFGTLWLNATTEDIPVIVKTVVDAVGNVGAAVCIYESTSLPPK